MSILLPLCLIAAHTFLRARIRTHWRQIVHLTDSSDPTDEVTADEFRHVALTIALAISNPREWNVCIFLVIIIGLFWVTDETDWDVT